MRARENPFRSERVEALGFRGEGFSWEVVEARLEEVGGRGAIVGPCGRGKTTLLGEWCARRRELDGAARMIRIREGQRRLKPEEREIARRTGGGWVLLDGAEQLGWLGWREFLHLVRGSGRVVVSTHEAGRLPTVWECASSAGLLRRLVGELGGEAVDCEAIWGRCRGDLRMALRDFYDRAAASGEGDGGEWKSGAIFREVPLAMTGGDA